MSLKVGTIVTRQDIIEKVQMCETGTCVGKVTKVIPYITEPDNPTIVVRWWESCEYHSNRTNVEFHYLSEQLLEIGQMF